MEFFSLELCTYKLEPSCTSSGADLEGGCRGCAPSPEMTYGFLIQLVFCRKKKTMWFIGVEVEQETSAPPSKKTPGSTPDNIRLTVKRKRIFCCISFLLLLEFCKSFTSSNLRWRLRCGTIFVTAYSCTDYCANPELSSTLARRLN